MRQSRSRGARSRPPIGKYRIAAALMVALTVYGALLPFQFTPLTNDEARAAFHNIAVFPVDQLGARGDWVISTAQYVLLSFLVAAACTVGRHFRARLAAALAAALASATLALALEIAQMYFPPRTVSLNDIAVETTGGLLGAGLWLVFGRRVDEWIGRLGTVSTVARSANRLLPAYLLALFVIQLMPFDFVVSLSELEVKYDEGKIHLIPFHDLAPSDGLMKALLNFTCFLPLGFLASVSRPTGNSRTRFPWAVLAVPVAVELLQLFAYSRSFDVTDILTGWIGVIAGARLASLARASWVLQPSAARRQSSGVGWLVLFGAWLLIVLYLNWRPFDFTTQAQRFHDPEEYTSWGLRRFAIAPFVDYYWGSKYNALDQFVRKGVSFLPLGVLFALAGREIFATGRAYRVVAAAIAIGLVVEAGRYFLPTRSPSLTDVVIGCAGALAGYLLMRFVRATIWSDAALGLHVTGHPTEPSAHPQPQPGIWLLVADVKKN